ncbi:MAG: MarR family winged helix-turn-helix transcriptional regulator [Marmoricola sp.]
MKDTAPPRRLAYLLSQLGTVAAGRFNGLVSELGLTAPEAGTLRLLAVRPGMSQRALAEKLGAVPSRVVVLLDSLEKQGLVSRQRSAADRRNHELVLTPAGKRMMGRLREVSLTHERVTVGMLSEAERDQLARLLGKLAEAHDLDPEVHPGYRHRG